MRRFIMISVMLLALFELTEATQAAQPANRVARRQASQQRRLSRREVMQLRAKMKGAPSIKISTTPEKINLGTTGFPGEHEASSIVTVKIDSNCLHGPIIASIKGLKHKSGKLIRPGRIFVRGPETYGYVSMARPVVISKPAIGPHSVDLSFKVNTDLDDPAGGYEGVITFTIAPPS